MREHIRFIVRHYWVEILLIPPFVMALCYYLYGDIYFSSWKNFGYLSFPWLFTAIASPIACHWVRRSNLRRFTKLEDWPKRVIWSVFGYLFFTVGFAKTTYWVLCYTHFGGIIPTERKFSILVILAAMIVLIIATLYECITYFEKWKEAISETEQLEKLYLETQFQSLQSQLNPHFLFNGLNVLSSLIAESPRRAEDFVDELSNVYRYLLRSNDREIASVGEELRFIRSFFHLLETRYDTGVSMKINVRQEIYDTNLPALALQILVENAVKHNEISPEKPLKIEIFDGKNTGQTCLIIRNNLQRKATRPASNHVGLENLRQRYALLGKSGFEVQNDGRYFIVTLPIL
jgi:two-component system, LytTR family, sensor kinase